MTTKRIGCLVSSACQEYFKHVNERGRGAVARYLLYKGFGFTEIMELLNVKEHDYFIRLLDGWTEFWVKETPTDDEDNPILELYCMNRNVEFVKRV